uniref:CN hydrolase domain-containing protein n=1 Tax=Steinernema glaseri TaxID=37863 RepID=A0A1I7Z3C1_9BILA
MMGCRCSKGSEQKPERKNASASVAALVFQANRAAALMASDLCGIELEAELARRLIRRAKNDGATVSVVNGCLYLDYKFVGFLPAGVRG